MKLLQGSMFIHIREKILNLPASENTDVHRSLFEIEKNQEKLDGSKRICSNPMMNHKYNKANDKSWTRASRTSS